MNRVELGQVGKIAFRVAIVLAMVGLAACDGGSKETAANQTPLATPTLVPSSTPTPDMTPTPRYAQVRNPFTSVVYTIDENGCAVIPSGGTAYGAATVLGDPSNPLDISPLQLIRNNGVKENPVNRPNDLSSLTYSGDKVCPGNISPSATPAAFKGTGRYASTPGRFDLRASKPVFAKS